MDSRWIKNATDREARRKQVMSYRPALQELKEILEQNFKKKEAVRDYEPGWEYKQIATNEWNAALAEILKLIDIKE